MTAVGAFFLIDKNKVYILSNYVFECLSLMTAVGAFYISTKNLYRNK